MGPEVCIRGQRRLAKWAPQLPQPLGSLSSVTGPRGGGCLACGVGPTGSSSPLRLGTPGQQRGAAASVCSCVCWCVLCMCTLMGCESMAGPAVSEPHFQPCPRETVVLEGSLWQGHGPHPDLPTRTRTQAWTPHAAWGRGPTPCGPPRTLSRGPALCLLWGSQTWAPLPQPRLRSKAQWAPAAPRPRPTQHKHTCKCFQKQAKAKPQSRWGPGWKAPLTLRPKQQNPDPGHLHCWGRGPGWARWLGWFLTTLPPGPGPRPRPRPLTATGPACAVARPRVTRHPGHIPENCLVEGALRVGGARYSPHEQHLAPWEWASQATQGRSPRPRLWAHPACSPSLMTLHSPSATKPLSLLCPEQALLNP